MKSKKRIVVRKATSKDVAGMVNVLKRTRLQDEKWKQNEKWVKQALEKFLKTTNYTVFVAEVEGEIAGFTGVVVYPSLWESSLQGLINDFFVSEDFVGKGLGTKLLETLVEWADAQRIGELHASTDWENEVARRLYGKFGFTEERLLLERTADE